MAGTVQGIVSARAAVRAFLTDAIADRDEINTSTLILQARDALAADPEFQAALVYEGLAVLVSTQLEALTHERRQEARGSDERVREIAARIFESTGPSVRKSLLAMRRSELLYAARQREVAAAGLLRWASLERDLAARMNNTQTVGERFGDRALERIWRTHFPT